MGKFHNQILYGHVSARNADKHGWMNHSQYLDVAEDARLHWLLSIGISQRELQDERGIVLPAIDAHAQYKAGSKYEEEVAITTKLKKIGGTSMIFEHEVITNSGLVSIVDVVLVYASLSPMGKKPIDDDVRAKLEANLDKDPPQPDFSLFQKNFLGAFKSRVAYRNTGPIGYVNPNEHLHIFEDARLEFFLSKGISQAAMLADNKRLKTVSSSPKYIKDIDLEDEVAVSTEIFDISGNSVHIHQKLFANGELAAELDITLDYVNKETSKPLKLPDEIKAKLGKRFTEKYPPVQHGAELMYLP